MYLRGERGGLYYLAGKHHHIDFVLFTTREQLYLKLVIHAA